MKLTMTCSVLATMVLTACVDSNRDNNGGGEIHDQGSLIAYTERVVPVNRDGKPAEEVTLRFYSDQPNVAYISARNFHHMMLPHQQLAVSRNGNIYELSSHDGQATVDISSDTFTSDDITAFTNMQSLTGMDIPNLMYDESGFVRPKSVETTPKTARVTLDFHKYGIDLRGDEQDVYLPFTLINDLYSDLSLRTAGFNGERIVICVNINRSPIQAVDSTFIIANYQRESIPADLARYRYQDLCFTIDNLIGHTKRSPYEAQWIANGIDHTLEAQGEEGRTVRRLLQSANTAEFILGMQALQYYVHDGGHTWVNITRYCPTSILPGVNQRLAEVRSTYPLAARLADEGAKMTQEKFTIEKEMNALREKVLGKGRYFKKGNTALCVILTFIELDWEGWPEYYKGGPKPTLEKTPDDEMLVFLDAWQRAQADPEVEHFIIDCSSNTGGSSDISTAFTSILYDDSHLRYKNTMTGQQSDLLFDVDRNFDGRYDEKDKEVKNRLNVGVLCSACTWSCGNLFTARMKELGALVIGEMSAGGSCAIQHMSTADGLDYRISSFRNQVTYNGGQSVDPGIEPHKLLDRKNHPESFYDIEALGKMMDEYYKNLTY